MFAGWRLKLREAKLAVAQGRWDDAAALLASPELKDFQPAKVASHDLATKLVARAGTRIAGGQSMAGWSDLQQAARLGADEAVVDAFRRDQKSGQIEAVVDLLSRGETRRALAALDKMASRRIGGAEATAWRHVAEAMDHGHERGRRGDFPAAIQSMERAARMVPGLGADSLARDIQTQLEGLRSSMRRHGDLDAKLHAALARGEWTEVLVAADALLELAPEHAAARQARRQAWRAVGMEATRHYQPSPAGRPSPAPWRRQAGQKLAQSTRRGAGSVQGDTVKSGRKESRRLVAWIDAVGAYLVCLGDEIVLGQPSADGGVDVPLLADLSRRHAIVRREGESYVLTPLHRSAIDGREVREPTILRDKSIIKLGDAVELRFRKPHALSGTAVLEVLTHHKTEPAVDGVVLMSESCILGPQGHAHVHCRHFTGELVLFRRGEELVCRGRAPLAVDGEAGVAQATVGPLCRIETDEFGLSFEQI